jgi:beta-ureidopropionase / N-carbamoyl-L-amino-acid hydrolase
MSADLTDLVARGVNGSRLASRHNALAAIGALHPQGLCREAFSAADAEARGLICDWAAASGYVASIDAIGNMFFAHPGADPTIAPILIGSHIDSQPAGGPFDGQFGVLAAWEAFEALHESGLPLRRPVEVAIWANEEGSRFQPTTMGSAVFARRLPLQRALAATDTAGRTVAAELQRLRASLGEIRDRALGFPVAAYVEAHIEQGPILERRGIPIGVVTSIQGLRWFTVEVAGRTGHAGTTPEADRRDAFVAAHNMIRRLRDLMADPEDVVRFTIGRFEVHPNAPNTIPGSVLFTIDFRHPDAAVLKRLGDQVEQICREAGGPQCQVTITETLDSPPTILDEELAGAIARSADELGIRTEPMTSGATHDAKYLAMVCPTAMLFIPCRDGISHSVLEHADPEHVELGTRVLAGALGLIASDGR